MWDLPRPGLEPVYPALAGRFSTTAPPGKPLQWTFYIQRDQNVCVFLSDRFLDTELLSRRVFTFKILIDNIRLPSKRLCQFILHTLLILLLWHFKKCFQFDGWNIVLFHLHWLVKLNVFAYIYWPFVFLIVWSACSYPLLIFLLCFHFLLVISRGPFYFVF